MRNFEKELGERIRIANKSFRILQDPHLKIVYDEAYQLLFEIWSQSNSIDERENIYKTKEALD